MKIKTKKIIIFCVIVAVVFSLTAISCFAIDEGYIGEYSFGKELDLETFVGLDQTISFVSNGASFIGMKISYRGYYVLDYIGADSSTALTVYTSIDGWSNEGYRDIEFIESIESLDLIGFLDVNEYHYYLYSEIESVIVNALFGDRELTGDQSLTVSLLCTTLSLLVILVPFFICGFIFVFILKRV